MAPNHGAGEISEDELQFLYHHVFLPPQLPEDAEISFDARLLELLEKAAREYRSGISGSADRNIWQRIGIMFKNLRDIRSKGHCNATKVELAITAMRAGDMLALQISAQNAGIILRQKETVMQFEAFEAAPTAHKVVHTDGNLLCTYPGPAVTVPLDKFKSANFLHEFAAFLQAMDQARLEQSAPMIQDKSNKGSMSVEMVHDTADPMFITSMLTGLLRGLGQPVQVTRFQKRIRDEALGEESKELWRRSALWLICRVALQSTLSHTEYKNFMIFFIANLVDLSARCNMRNDDLFVVCGKLARRMGKVDFPLHSFVSEHAANILQAAINMNKRRWKKQLDRSPKKWEPESLAFDDDTCLSFNNSAEYLNIIQKEELVNPEVTLFNPMHYSRISLTSEALPERKIQNTDAAERYIALADLEHWVDSYLEIWLKNNIPRETACASLAHVLNDYVGAARKAYNPGSEDASIMLLTAAELWVALDKIALRHYPLLKDYAPDVSEKDKLFQPLLLSKLLPMDRLQRVERYLLQRIEKADKHCPSVFSDNIREHAFAVRYYNQSIELQTLKNAIIQRATEQKAEIQQDLNNKQALYNRNRRKAQGLQCEAIYARNGRKVHRGGVVCQKCLLDEEAESQRVHVYEWPLPEDVLQMKAVVFELRCPEGFAVWRDATYNFFVDLCTPPQAFKQQDHPRPCLRLQDFEGLFEWIQDEAYRRLRFASRIKPSKRMYKPLPLTLGDVVIPHQHTYRLYDDTGMRWTHLCIKLCNVAPFCTASLPNGRYKNLEYAVNGTGHTSNEVISNQCDCDQALSIHEYYSFGVLRAGHCLTWANILREMRARTLSLNDEAVHLLIRTAAWQAGPPDRAGTSRRESHLDLLNREFGLQLLAELDHVLSSIETNWLEDTAAYTIITLACRLLSLTTDDEVIQNAYQFLQRVRIVTLQWTRELVVKMQSCDQEITMKQLQKRILKMALICRQTYDVDTRHLATLLDEDVCPFIECAIIIHDNSGDMAYDILDKDRRLAHTLEPRLRMLLREDRTPLDEAISQIWPAYSPGAQWRTMPPHNERWMVTETAGNDENARPLHAQWNLLSGQFLINGMPLGRLPSNYSTHPTFRRIFGEKILDVNPSDMDGVVFQTRYPISGYQVYFGMRVVHLEALQVSPEQLVIRTKRNGVIHELVPSNFFNEDLPESFIQGFHHWLNIANGEMELRPLEDPWTSSEDNWRVSCEYLTDDAGAISRLYCGTRQVFDVRSRTVQMISRILNSLDDEFSMDMSIDTSSKKVFVSLPRLKLKFFINDQNELECSQFRGMVVDLDQNIKTLVGLENKLVLRQATGSMSMAGRKVIIPHGDVNARKQRGHICVTISTKGQERVSYHTYDIDTKLGRLVGDGSLRSRLFKAYLHALTSYCLPDPLTGRTGTEEALSELRSAATLSFQKLEAREVTILKDIAALCPTRSYHPQKLKCMQTVTWSRGLSPLSQHEEFYDLVKKIFDYDSHFAIFHKDEEEKVKFEAGGNESLRRRAAIKNARYRVDEFGGDRGREAEDRVYTARHLIRSEKEMLVCQITTLTEAWPERLKTASDLMAVFTRWNYVAGAPQDGTNVPLVGYSPRWLESSALNYNLLPLYCVLRDLAKEDRYPLAFLLSTLVYSGVPMAMAQTLLAFATIPDFSDFTVPKYKSYTISEGFGVEEDKILAIVKRNQISFESSRDYRLPDNPGESLDVSYQRRRNSFNSKVQSEANKLTRYLYEQWPIASPRAPPPEERAKYKRLKLASILPEVSSFFASRFANMKLRRFVRFLQNVLDDLSPPTVQITKYSFQEPERQPLDGGDVFGITMQDLLDEEEREPVLPEAPALIGPTSSRNRRKTENKHEDEQVKTLVQDLSTGGAYGFWQYAQDLQKSLHAYRVLPKSTTGGEIRPYAQLLKDRERHEQHVTTIFKEIERVMLRTARGLTQNAGDILIKAGLTPRITPTSILRLLASDARGTLNNHWKNVFILYGQAIALLQRSERLLDCCARRDLMDFVKEAENFGGEGWDVYQQPDWLLLQIENNLLIRPVQARIAQEMIAPESGENSVCQLNMGEGKSSVIVPMVATALADGSKLVRVVVLKPLSSQMFQLLVQRLGGLINRRIFYMPFSRNAAPTIDSVTLIRELYEECMEVGGVLLVQPEHLLSFKLMGLERLFSGRDNQEIAKSLVSIQQFLDQKSRDVLDESDEILHVKYQLIYTLGTQRPIEHTPDRWQTIQQIFDLISEHATQLQVEYPKGIEREAATSSPGSFPVTRILDPINAGKALFSRIAADICAGRLPSISFRLVPEHLRLAVEQFITEGNLSEEECQPLLEYCAANASTMATLLLLRGLLAKGILMHALSEKRWRVDYGLDTSRSMLAVPYRAKDSPTVRSEFSHPDISLTLTCLTYYYNGLTEDQLKDCFQTLYKMDNPTIEYERWSKGYTREHMPDALRTLNGINLQDSQQFSEYIYPVFRTNKAVVDFHLSRVVFPKEAKEFPHKLPSSGWDLAEKKHGGHVTTGFSGSNDNKYLLPMSIQQRDLPEQSSTNAQVLSYLLRPENDHYICAKKENGERLPVVDLFKLVVEQEPKIRVVLDAGAQVLELKNLEVAELWLSLVPDDEVQAAVFFTEADELCVLSRDGHVEPLMISPYAKQLDVCVVYLDEVHCRGVDLKLPKTHRAACMLGPSLTKDKLAQTCMRMRKLGNGQSVMYFAPYEVHRRILDVAKKSEDEEVEVRDILFWVIYETCISTRNSIPLWATQGISYQKRRRAWLNYWQDQDVHHLADDMLEPEAQTLAQLYGFVDDTEDPLTAAPESGILSPEIIAIRNHCRHFGVSSLTQVKAQEEAEREVEFEAEREYQIERPPKVEPNQHKLEKEVKNFINTGKLPATPTQFYSAFNTLNLTSAREHYESGWSGCLWVTSDFAHSIKNHFQDEYMRPVQWIVSSQVGGEILLVIMSEYEVNQAMNLFRNSTKVRLHIYAPKVTMSMRPLDNLNFFTITNIPAPFELPHDRGTDALLQQLNLFAGQLYLRDLQAYEVLTSVLGLYAQEVADDENYEYIQPDGFVAPENRELLGMSDMCVFQTSPVQFLKLLYAFRRKGQDYWASHVGQILHGRVLRARDFEDDDQDVMMEERTASIGDSTTPSAKESTVLTPLAGNSRKRRRVTTSTGGASKRRKGKGKAR